MSLRDALEPILGDDLVGIWAHGGTTSIADPPHTGDLDTHMILARKPDAEAVRRIQAVHEATAREHDIEWDAWYLLVDDARRPGRPTHAFREERRDTSWAIHRAHWLAGRYALIHGVEPAELVPVPTWDELEYELDRELEHIERHVFEGDTDAYEATYAILNGSRILRAVATRDVVISKRAAGQWALANLPDRWHVALLAATRAYDGQAAPNDVGLIATEMAPFVAMVRDRLAPIERRADATPRWSGDS
jgi:hypothetical protein